MHCHFVKFKSCFMWRWRSEDLFYTEKIWCKNLINFVFLLWKVNFFIFIKGLPEFSRYQCLFFSYHDIKIFILTLFKAYRPWQKFWVLARKKGFFQVRTIEKYVLNKITKHFSTLLTWQLDYKISNNVPVCTIGKFWLKITIKERKAWRNFFPSLKREIASVINVITQGSTSDIKLYCYIFIKKFHTIHSLHHFNLFGSIFSLISVETLLHFVNDPRSLYNSFHVL